MVQRRRIGTKLYATAFWLLFAPAVVLSALMLVRALHDHVTKARAFACLDESFRREGLTSPHELEVLWDEAVPLDADEMPTGGGSDGGWRSRARLVSTTQKTEAIGSPKPPFDPDAYLASKDSYPTAERERTAERTAFRDCGVAHDRGIWTARGTWGAGARNNEAWLELLGSLVAFVPVVILAVGRRWWRWLMRPEP